MPSSTLVGLNRVMPSVIYTTSDSHNAYMHCRGTNSAAQFTKAQLELHGDDVTTRCQTTTANVSRVIRHALTDSLSKLVRLLKNQRSRPCQTRTTARRTRSHTMQRCHSKAILLCCARSSIKTSPLPPPADTNTFQRKTFRIKFLFRFRDCNCVCIKIT